VGVLVEFGVKIQVARGVSGQVREGLQIFELVFAVRKNEHVDTDLDVGQFGP